MAGGEWVRIVLLYRRMFNFPVAVRNFCFVRLGCDWWLIHVRLFAVVQCDRVGVIFLFVCIRASTCKFSGNNAYSDAVGVIITFSDSFLFRLW